MKAIVVEDSRLAREGLVRMLGAFAQFEVVGAADHPSTALALIGQCAPDVIFLDIHMPGESGFELLAKLDYQPRIVFTTAHAEYAVKSFDFNTIDYLLKPISQERLAQAVARLGAGGAGTEPASAGKSPLALDAKIFIKDGEQCHLVALEAIHYIESCKNYVQVFFGDKKAYVKKSLNNIEERLPKQVFFRASRQHIINLRAIRDIEESINFGFKVTMNDGRVLEISRRNGAELRDMLSF
ncbi:LytR/AlgR family response regulator transcription factor [Massilia glaciei]|uniref:DNA-binding response regulator n=1 Tax=Massilia glaciei TaxID=1524097 RepID=A0A2U2HLS4_9BURK|nr:LytTR family transcriptional regulator DNA-binding domain-containing protein [Massilia glaciei]PWF48471.1 DNA-binding response regulator [Massilia glaciei]